jgi:flagellar hook-associated protein 1 FlgK
VPSPDDPLQVEVGYQSGATIALIAESSIQGGTLGGLLSFRSASLDAAQNAFGRVAMGLAQTFNDQHALGQDLYGTLGGTFFSFDSPNVLQSSDNKGAGAATLTLQNVNALTTSDYRLQSTTTAADTAAGDETFLLTRISDGFAFPKVTFTTVGGSGSLTQDGITVTLSAGAKLNDSWLIQPTRLGAGSIGVLVKDPAAFAAASPMRTGAALANTGSATISAGSVTSVASLPLPAAAVTLTFNAAFGRFDVTGDVAPMVATIAYSPDVPVSFKGTTFTISGTPADGDEFTLERNTNAVADNRNVLALGALQTANTLGKNAGVPGSQPTTTFQGAYSQLVSQVGNSTRQMEVTATAQQNLIAQTKRAQQSVSGVNLDEEAANLLRYQQAYQASGKMMQIASTLFQTVLDLGR